MTCETCGGGGFLKSEGVDLRDGHWIAWSRCPDCAYPASLATYQAAAYTPPRKPPIRLVRIRWKTPVALEKLEAAAVAIRDAGATASTEDGGDTWLITWEAA